MEQVQTNETLDTYSEVYHFKPSIEDLNKHVVLKISGGTDIASRLEKLGLPNEKGDLITIEVGVKEVQSKLIKEEKKDEEKEDEEKEDEEKEDKESK